ncbi:hypothetical protein A2U01_0106226, partial [Trifolium medium]|nr:hypothetical protein [Trifolium medium]
IPRSLSSGDKNPSTDFESGSDCGILEAGSGKISEIWRRMRRSSKCEEFGRVCNGMSDAIGGRG